MSTIGIITFHESPNYGAILQSFALERFLQNNSCETYIIDYRNAKRQYAQVTGLRKIRSLIWNYTFKRMFSDKTRRMRTDSFRNKYISKTKKIYTNLSSIKQAPPDFDCYITGSDQVWNKRNNNGDLAYFLDFVPIGKKRISYAPSFGAGKMDDDYLETIKSLVEKIDYLSVREKSGANIIKNLCSIDAKVVCDPIFLLTQDQWREIMKCPEEGSYILCYYMPGDKIVEKKIFEIAKTLGKATGFRIVNIGKKDYDKLRFWEPNRYDYGPEEFVGAIANAEYIVTNSFHGTAFSILFGKKLIVPYRNDLPKEKALNTRIIELMQMAGREEALLPCNKTIDLYVIKNASTVLSLSMQEYIEKSKSFLIEAVRVHL